MWTWWSGAVGTQEVVILFLQLLIFFSKWKWKINIWNYSAVRRSQLGMTHCSLNGPPENHEGRETPIPKGYMVYVSIYRTFLKWQHCGNGGRIHGCQGLRGWVGKNLRERFKVAILDLLLHYSFVRCYHGGTLGHGLFLTTAYDIYNHLKIQSLKRSI